MENSQPRCFFDVEVDGERGRIIFELFGDKCPKTCENFRALCTGEMGTSAICNKPLHYKGSPFHRVVKGFMIQSGDFTQGNGKGGESVYGRFFPDENLALKHDTDLLLSMANRGKDTNGSQFFITTQPAPHLDGVHVVFGKVIFGKEVVKKIEDLEVDDKSRPKVDVKIVNSGELVLKLKSKAKKKRKVSTEEESDSSSEEEKKKKKKKEKKKKSKEKKRKQESEEEEKENVDTEPKFFSTIRPEDIPDIPVNKFLDRGPRTETTNNVSPLEGRRPYSRVRYNREGKKIKGRGNLRYQERRERSATPPHWRKEQSKLTDLASKQGGDQEQWKEKIRQRHQKKESDKEHKERRRRDPQREEQHQRARDFNWSKSEKLKDMFRHGEADSEEEATTKHSKHKKNKKEKKSKKEKRKRQESEDDSSTGDLKESTKSKNRKTIDDSNLETHEGRGHRSRSDRSRSRSIDKSYNKIDRTETRRKSLREQDRSRSRSHDRIRNVDQRDDHRRGQKQSVRSRSRSYDRNRNLNNRRRGQGKSERSRSRSHDSSKINNNKRRGQSSRSDENNGRKDHIRQRSSSSESRSSRERSPHHETKKDRHNDYDNGNIQRYNDRTRRSLSSEKRIVHRNITERQLGSSDSDSDDIHRTVHRVKSAVSSSRYIHAVPVHDNHHVSPVRNKSKSASPQEVRNISRGPGRATKEIYNDAILHSLYAGHVEKDDSTSEHSFEERRVVSSSKIDSSRSQKQFTRSSSQSVSPENSSVRKQKYQSPRRLDRSPSPDISRSVSMRKSRSRSPWQQDYPIQEPWQQKVSPEPSRSPTQRRLSRSSRSSSSSSSKSSSSSSSESSSSSSSSSSD